MKRILNILVCLMVSIFATFAYEPMLKNGRMWTRSIYCDMLFDGQHTARYSDSIWIVTDTIIDSRTYHTFSNGMLMREDIEKHIVYRRKGGEDFLLYNFDVNIGDTLLSNNLIDSRVSVFHNSMNYIVSQIDTIQQHRTISLEPIIDTTIFTEDVDELKELVWLFKQEMEIR